MGKTYILDTSVLIDNPNCVDILRNGDDNQVLIPYSVILELDKLKRKPGLSPVVAEVTKRLEGEDGFRIIKHPDIAYRDEDTGDEWIIEDVRRFYLDLPGEERDTTFVISNDRLFRIRLGVEGLPAQEFKSSHPVESESQFYTGFVEETEPPVPNSFSWVEGRPRFNGAEPRIVDHENNPWNITPRTVYQNLAMELMLEPSIDLVSLQSRAGYGKTYIALACALALVFQKPKSFNKIYIVKPNVEIGEKIGFLPGEIGDKLGPYYKPIEDLIRRLNDLRPAANLFIDDGHSEPVLNPKRCEILPLNYLRGMNLEDCVVIVDEAQNLTRLQTRTLLTRMGPGVKCFVLGDTDQIDHPYLDKFNNGLNWIVMKFRGFWNYGHIVLRGAKSRGPITDMTLKANL